MIESVKNSLCNLAVVLALVSRLWINCTGSSETKEAEYRLRRDLLQYHSPTTLPAHNSTVPVNVKLGLAIRQILDVDEKNQVIVTSIWFRQYWQDDILYWNASEYQGLASLHLTTKDIWVPDIALYNTASDHSILYKRLDTQIVLTNEGSATWLTPIQLKSECKINVRYYPFDEQVCKLTFGSWTYHGRKLDLFPVAPSADMSSFVANTEWEIIETPFFKQVQYYGCCPEPYPTLTVEIRIRRRALFYVSNLIIPCALIAFLGSLAFFLPSDNGERISLVVTVLLSLTVYMLIVSDTMPPTSDVIPLIGKFYVCTTVLIALTLVSVIVSLNCCDKDHKMSRWSHKIIFGYLGRIVGVSDSRLATESSQAFIMSNNVEPLKGQIKDNVALAVTKDENQLSTLNLQNHEESARRQGRGEGPLNTTDADDTEKYKAEWKQASRVLDRIFFLLFLTFYFLMSVIIFSQAPKVSLS